MNPLANATKISILTPDALFAKYSRRIALGLLIDDCVPHQAWRVALRVWQDFPAYFPLFASDIVRHGAQEACAALEPLLRDVPGACDISCALDRLADGNAVNEFFMRDLRM